jgi:hypothetical protein
MSEIEIKKKRTSGRNLIKKIERKGKKEEKDLEKEKEIEKKMREKVEWG